MGSSLHPHVKDISFGKDKFDSTQSKYFLYKTVCSTNVTGSNLNDIHSAGKMIITAQKVRLALQAFREDCCFILHSLAVLKRSIDMS